MDYIKLIKTVSLMVENEEIETEGLVLTYYLNEKDHTKMNQELYYKTNPTVANFTPSDEFEVEVGGILVKFIKK
jgi:hypothetical protein